MKKGEARKYLIIRHDSRHTQHWSVRATEEIGVGFDGAVTAYDSRDVGPLVEAARTLIELKDGPRDDEYCRAKGSAWNALRNALALFDSEEKT